MKVQERLSREQRDNTELARQIEEAFEETKNSIQNEVKIN